MSEGIRDHCHPVTQVQQSTKNDIDLFLMSTNKIFSLLHEMVVFMKVVEGGSFSEAARQLGITPSAASRAIGRLEQELGTRLLQRTTRKLRLSDSGAEVYRHGQDMMNAVQSVAAVSNSESAPAGKLRITAPRALGRFLIHPYMGDFLATNPGIDLIFRMEDRYVDLIDEQVDLALRITDNPSPGLMGRRLLRIDQVICATPTYLVQHGEPKHPHDLKQHSCIALSEDTIDSRWKFSKDGKGVSVDVQGRYTVNHAGARLDAILSGWGIGGVPYFMAKEALDSGRLVRVLPAWKFKTNYQGDAWVLYPQTRHLSPRIRAFVEFIAQRLQEDKLLAEAVHAPSSTEPIGL